MFHFLGIGAQKAATTWLFEQLNTHPEIHFPNGKEQHFWNHQPDDAAIARYLNQFTHPTQREGEITPAYAFLPPAIITQIYQHAPHLRLFYLIRNPIDRAWSAALMALNRAEMTITEASDQWFIDHFHSQGSLLRGDYELALRNWQSVFPPDQFLLLRYECVVQEPRALLIRLAHHLAIDSDCFLTAPAAQLHRKSFSGNGAPLRPSLRRVLETLYRPRITALDQYLGYPTGW